MAEKLLKSNILLNRMRRIVRSEQLVLSILAMVVGALAGGGTILFRDGLLFVQSLIYGTSDEALHTYLADLPAWHLILGPTAGGLIVGIFIYKFLPEKRPHGVADVIEAASFHDARMSTRCGIKSAIASAFSLGSGSSLGREGRLFIWGPRSGLGWHGSFICVVRLRVRCSAAVWRLLLRHRLTPRSQGRYLPTKLPLAITP